MGLEPTTFGITIRCSNQLSYAVRVRFTAAKVRLTSIGCKHGLLTSPERGFPAGSGVVVIGVLRRVDVVSLPPTRGLIMQKLDF